MKKFLAIIAVIFLVASCNTTKKTETKTSSWETVKVETNSWAVKTATGKTEEPKKEEVKKEETKKTGPQAWIKKMIIIWDKTCKVCAEPKVSATVEKIESWIKSNPLFKDVEIKTYDISDPEAQKIAEENWITWLPIILVDSNEIIKWQVDPSLKKTKAGLYSAPWAIYDFKTKKFLVEVWSLCEDKKDNDGNWKIDCQENSCLATNPTACAKEIKKIQEEQKKKYEEAMKKQKEEQAKKLAKIKSDKPKVDLFVMSQCPFGTQAEKWFLEVMNKFKGLADVNIKFVQYTMHGKKEADENIRQYCIKKEQNDKFTKYLACYLKAWDTESCQKEVWIDSTKLAKCFKETDKKFAISNKFDGSTQYPEFSINKDEALKAWVQGSPTLVIEWVKVDWVGRNARAYAEVICKAFNKAPAICNDLTKFSDKTYNPWFGFNGNTNSNAPAAWCGK